MISTFFIRQNCRTRCSTAGNSETAEFHKQLERRRFRVKPENLKIDISKLEAVKGNFLVRWLLEFNNSTEDRSIGIDATKDKYGKPTWQDVPIIGTDVHSINIEENKLRNSDKANVSVENDTTSEK